MGSELGGDDENCCINVFLLSSSVVESKIYKCSIYETYKNIRTTFPADTFSDKNLSTLENHHTHKLSHIHKETSFSIHTHTLLHPPTHQPSMA